MFPAKQWDIAVVSWIHSEKNTWVARQYPTKVSCADYHSQKLVSTCSHIMRNMDLLNVLVWSLTFYVHVGLSTKLCQKGKIRFLPSFCVVTVWLLLRLSDFVMMHVKPCYLFLMLKSYPRSEGRSSRTLRGLSWWIFSARGTLYSTVPRVYKVWRM